MGVACSSSQPQAKGKPVYTRGFQTNPTTHHITHYMTKPGQTLRMGGQYDLYGVQDVLYITNFHSYGHEQWALAGGGHDPPHSGPQVRRVN